MSSRGSAKRKQEQAQKAAARRGTRKGVRLLTVLVVGVVVLLVAGAIIFRGEHTPSAGPGGGAVWSAEHGHWH